MYQSTTYWFISKWPQRLGLVRLMLGDFLLVIKVYYTFALCSMLLHQSDKGFTWWSKEKVSRSRFGISICAFFLLKRCSTQKWNFRYFFSPPPYPVPYLAPFRERGSGFFDRYPVPTSGRLGRGVLKLSIEIVPHP